MTTNAAQRLSFALSVLVAGSPEFVLGDDGITRLVDCTRGQSIQKQIDKRNPDRTLTLVIRGTCTEDVTIDRDDLVLVGETGASVNGTISIPGSRRVAIRTLTVSSPSGPGIFGTDNAGFTVEDSSIVRNATEGVSVRNGAHANLRRNRLAENGLAAGPDSGRGIYANHNGSVDASNNTIVGNRSDGVGIFNGSYARLTENTIEGNGRLGAEEAGVQVNRARVRAHGNIIRNNTGRSAVNAVNFAEYRTGSGLNAADFPDNEFPFERIEHPVGPGLLAIDINQFSYGDFRQVHIVGSISVGPQSMLHLRGDDLGPNLTCSSANTTGGSFSVSGRNGLARLRFTNVTPPVVTFTSGTNGQVDGVLTCAAP
jgi:hypothetical protein